MGVCSKDGGNTPSDNEEATLSIFCTACPGRLFKQFYLKKNEWNEEDYRNEYRNIRSVLPFLHHEL